jgi:hypothetical protein
VFRASQFRARGSFRSVLALRSAALVQSLACCPSSLLVGFPSGAAPAGLLPSSVVSVAFGGFGSGSWSSLALAVGLGVRSLVWLPSGVVPPSWGFDSLGCGWWLHPGAGSGFFLPPAYSSLWAGGMWVSGVDVIERAIDYSESTVGYLAPGDWLAANAFDGTP